MANCPKCGCELPDEAHFCLHCFALLEGEDVSVKPERVAVQPKPEKQPKLLPFIKSKQFKSVVSCFLIVSLLCVSGVMLKKLSTRIVTVSQDEVTVITVTQENGEAVTDESGEAVTQAVIAVTSKNGEAVTNKNGSQVFKAVEAVTNSSGEKVTDASGKQVYAVNTDNQSGSSSETTTKKSIFDILFDRDDDKSTTAPSTSAATTEAPAITQPSTTETTVSTTEAPATTQPSTTETTSISSQDDFEYEEKNGLIQINKYTGNAQNVTVPSKINGVDVGYIYSGTFSDNSNIRNIKIESGASKLYLGDGTFGSDNGVFNNLPNLKSLTLPSTIQEILSISSAITGCPALEEVNVSGSSVYKSVDGVLFSCSKLKYVYANTLVYYPRGKKTSSYSVPSFCTDICGAAVSDNPYLTTFTVNSSPKNPDDLYWNFCGCTSLYAIYTNTDSDKVKSIDGVLYVIDVTGFSDGLGINNGAMNYYTQIRYPYAKTGSHFEFADGYKIMLTNTSFCGNTHIQSVRLPMYSRFDRECYTGKPFSAANLKTFYLADCDDSKEFADRYKNVFKDITILYY